LASRACGARPYRPLGHLLRGARPRWSLVATVGGARASGGDETAAEETRRGEELGRWRSDATCGAPPPKAELKPPPETAHRPLPRQAEGDPIARLHATGAPPSLHYRKRQLFAFPAMQLVQDLLHSQSLAILVCRLPNTSELHYTSLDSSYAAYQTPPVVADGTRNDGTLGNRAQTDQSSRLPSGSAAASCPKQSRKGVLFTKQPCSTCP
jgi:hypothetical protein